jgi:hypothetical protein
VDAVRHFLGFAGRSDARVVGRVRWRSFLASELPQGMEDRGCGSAPGKWAGEVVNGRQCPSDELGSQPFRVCTASHDPQPFRVSAKQTRYDNNPRRQVRSIFSTNFAQLVLKTPAATIGS